MSRVIRIGESTAARLEAVRRDDERPGELIARLLDWFEGNEKRPTRAEPQPACREGNTSDLG